MSEDTKQFIGVAIALAAWTLYSYWDSVAVVSYRYDAAMKDVHRARKPIDCDWGTAPIGSKGCDYQTSIYKDAEGKVWISWVKTEE